jgi:hypothetical protein
MPVFHTAELDECEPADLYSRLRHWPFTPNHVRGDECSWTAPGTQRHRRHAVPNVRFLDRLIGLWLGWVEAVFRRTRRDDRLRRKQSPTEPRLRG